MVNIMSIFKQAGDHLFWHRLDDDHVTDGGVGEAIGVDDAYVVVRMKEMYLGRIRLLWRKYYPMLHGFTDIGGEQEHAVAGPGQLQDLGDVNLDRVIVLNDRLSGPTPYRGGDVSILVGLYSVPGQDAAKALITTVGSFASLGGAAVGQAAQIAGLVKQGVDSILGLGETKLRLGVSDTFYAGNPLRGGIHIGIAARADEVPTEELWLRQGRLVKGGDPISARPYEDHDYLVIAIERVAQRDDWPALPEIVELNSNFAEIMAEGATDTTAKAEKLNALWPQFQQTLASSKHLTQPDRERIAGSVQQDLANRLKALRSGGPFETRSWGEPAASPAAATEFDLAAVPDYIDSRDEQSRALGVRALEQPAAF